MKGPLLEDRARVGLIRVFFVVHIRKDQFINIKFKCWRVASKSPYFSICVMFKAL